MSWFSRASSSRKEQGSVRTEAAPEVHRSLALAALFEEIRKGRKLQVLDLGSAVGSNVEFLSQTLQRSTDQILGRPGARVLLGAVIVN